MYLTRDHFKDKSYVDDELDEGWGFLQFHNTFGEQGVDIGKAENMLYEVIVKKEGEFFRRDFLFKLKETKIFKNCIITFKSQDNVNYDYVFNEKGLLIEENYPTYKVTYKYDDKGRRIYVEYNHSYGEINWEKTEYIDDKEYIVTNSKGEVEHISFHFSPLVRRGKDRKKKDIFYYTWDYEDDLWEFKDGKYYFDNKLFTFGDIEFTIVGEM